MIYLFYDCIFKIKFMDSLLEESSATQKEIHFRLEIGKHKTPCLNSKYSFINVIKGNTKYTFRIDALKY